MKNPFVFGKTVTGKDFCNRTKEIDFLHNQFNSYTNTILISPRRWGKSSLVEEASNRFKNKNVKFVFIDMFRARTPEEFYRAFVDALLKSTNSKMEDAFHFASAWLKNLIPHLSFQPDPLSSEFTVKLKFDPSIDEDTLLNLPQIIAQKKKIDLVVCIDEFQNISNFENSTDYQKKLRSYWQRHKNVNYCLYGSKRHLMAELFESSDLPFYKFGHVLYLNKIPDHEWTVYIANKFKATGKSISNSLIENICHTVDNHSYYIQQLSQIVWYQTTKNVTEETINTSLDLLCDVNELQFENEIDKLTTYQINLLKAIAHGVQELSSQETIETYQLGTSATVNRSKKALIEKDILDEVKGEIQINDPAFMYWFRHRYLAD